MTELLRGELGYDGIIQTDWGLSPTPAALAGADALGGAGTREVKKLVDQLSEEQLNEKVLRLLTVKFELGIFENPYVDAENAVATLSNPEHKALAREAAANALTMVKYEDAVPLAAKSSSWPAPWLTTAMRSPAAGRSNPTRPGASLRPCAKRRRGKRALHRRRHLPGGGKLS